MGSDDEKERDYRRRDRERSRSRSRERRRKRSVSRERSRSRSRSRERRRGGERDDREKGGRKGRGDKAERREKKEKESRMSGLRDEEDEETNEVPAVPLGIIPKANTTESNGEVSCSVEETNRIRAMLGLKPLRMEKMESSTEIAMKNLAEKRAQEKKELELAELEARIARARNKRLLEEKLSGATLSEVGEEKELLSAADWVKRSRAKEELRRDEDRLLAERRRKMMEEEEEEDDSEDERAHRYTTKDLAGLKVAHGAEDINEGQEVVLTIKDSDVLERDEHGNLVGINEEGGVELENVLLIEEQKAKEREKRKKRARKPAYNALDDEEFEGQPGQKRALLSQYDEEQREEEERRRKGMVLTGEGALDVGEKPAQGDGANKPVESLKVDKRAADEYMNVEEAAKFNKPKKLRKKKNQRKKESDIVAELEATADQSTEEQAAASREAIAKKREEAEAQARAERQAAYAAAVAKRKATDRVVASAQQQTTSTSGGSRRRAMDDDIEEDMDPDLQASLDRARRLAMRKERDRAAVAEMTNGDVGKVVADRVKRSASKAKEQDANGSVIFTPTVEFSSLLQARLEENNRAKAEQSIGAAAASLAVGAEDDEDMDIEEEAEEEENNAQSNWKEIGGEEEEEAEELDFLHKQPVVARGMAATLSLLRNTGELSKAEKPVGRFKDKKTLYDVGAWGKDQAPPPTADKFKDLKIEYRDKDGQLLTTKEEFRQLCYRFHGYGSSVKNETKRRKRKEEAEQQGSVAGAGWTALGKAQETTGQAFVVLSGSSKGMGALGGATGGGGGKGKGK